MRGSPPSDSRLPQPPADDRSGVQSASDPGATADPRLCQRHCPFTPSGVRPPELPPQCVALCHLNPCCSSPLPTTVAASNPLPIPATAGQRYARSHCPFTPTWRLTTRASGTVCNQSASRLLYVPQPTATDRSESHSLPRPGTFRPAPCLGTFGPAPTLHCPQEISSCLGAAPDSSRASSPACRIGASSVKCSSATHYRPAQNLALAATSSVKCDYSGRRVRDARTH